MLALTILALLPSQQPQPESLIRLRARNAAIRQHGEAAKAFLDALGDEAAYGLNACEPLAAGKLLAAYNAGKLAPIRRVLPRLMRLVAAYRGFGHTLLENPHLPDRIALFIVNNVEELQDPDLFAAFISYPQDYSLGLRKMNRALLKQSELKRSE